jgi:hypothetical protein
MLLLSRDDGFIAANLAEINTVNSRIQRDQVIFVDPLDNNTLFVLQKSTCIL